MTAILTDIGSVVTAGLSWLSSTVTTITAEGNELLLFGVVIGFVGIGISLLRRCLAL